MSDVCAEPGASHTLSGWQRKSQSSLHLATKPKKYLRRRQREALGESRRNCAGIAPPELRREGLGGARDREEELKEEEVPVRHRRHLLRPRDDGLVLVGAVGPPPPEVGGDGVDRGVPAPVERARDKGDVADQDVVVVVVRLAEEEDVREGEEEHEGGRLRQHARARHHRGDRVGPQDRAPERRAARRHPAEAGIREDLLRREELVEDVGEVLRLPVHADREEDAHHPHRRRVDRLHEPRVQRVQPPQPRKLRRRLRAPLRRRRELRVGGVLDDDLVGAAVQHGWQR